MTRHSLSHTLSSLVALSKCKLAEQSKIYIFCDGPKQSEDSQIVHEVQNIVKSNKWCGEVEIYTSDINNGLANSIINGVTLLCNIYGKVIVIEDDLVVAEGFLEYMNNALNTYNDCAKVAQISGHIVPFNPICNKEDAFFMPISCTWGWATWKRAWDNFDVKAVGYEKLATDEKLRYEFDLDNICHYTEMLNLQMSGKIDSWGIRWWWNFFNMRGLCLYPKYSLVNNIGFDETATHTIKTETYHADPDWDVSRTISILPTEIVIDNNNFLLYKKYIKSSSCKPNILVRGYRLLLRYIAKCTQFNIKLRATE